VIIGIRRRCRLYVGEHPDGDRRRLRLTSPISMLHRCQLVIARIRV
jgi:hypothetical protein